MKILYVSLWIIFILSYAVFHYGFRTGGAEQLYRINDRIAFEVQPESENYNKLSIQGFKPTGKIIGFLCGECQTEDAAVFLANAQYRSGDWVYTDFPQHEQAQTDIVNLRTGETIEAKVPADFKFDDDLAKLAEYRERGLIKSDEFRLTPDYIKTNFQPLSSFTTRCVYIHVLFLTVALFLVFPQLISWIIEAAADAFDQNDD